MKTKQYISIAELAKTLGISRIAVYKKVKKGTIKGVKIGRNYVISKQYYKEKISEKKYTSIPQLAQSLNISRRAVLFKVNQGIIKGKKIGRNFVVSKEYIQIRKKEKQFISIPQMAKLLKISRIAVFKKVKKGEIKAIKIGKRYAISKKYIKEKFGDILRSKK